jgi:hypothetical protein
MRSTGALCGLAVAFALLPWHSPVVEACGFAMPPQNYERELVASADQAAQELDYSYIVDTLQYFSRNDPEPDAKPADLAVRRRAERMLARAVVDSGGKFVPRAVEDASTHERIGWAVARLQRLLESDPEDPQVLTDLGVALSKLPEREEHARAILEPLAGRDLITTAQGWAALAHLRRDGAGKQAATRRCLLMARSPAATCNLPFRSAGGVAAWGGRS